MLHRVVKKIVSAGTGCVCGATIKVSSWANEKNRRVFTRCQLRGSCVPAGLHHARRREGFPAARAGQLRESRSFCATQCWPCSRGRSRNINTNFGDARVDLTARDRAERCPAKNRQVVSSDQSGEAQVISVPGFPIRSLSFKRRVSGGDALEVDCSHRLPATRLHFVDCVVHVVNSNHCPERCRSQVAA